VLLVLHSRKKRGGCGTRPLRDASVGLVDWEAHMEKVSILRTAFALQRGDFFHTPSWRSRYSNKSLSGCQDLVRQFKQRNRAKDHVRPPHPANSPSMRRRTHKLRRAVKTGKKRCCGIANEKNTKGEKMILMEKRKRSYKGKIWSQVVSAPAKKPVVAEVGR